MSNAWWLRTAAISTAVIATSALQASAGFSRLALGSGMRAHHRDRHAGELVLNLLSSNGTR